jgi:hypothetical protein
MATKAAELDEEDLCAWTRDQANSAGIHPIGTKLPTTTDTTGS